MEQEQSINNYEQLCVWRGTIVGAERAKEFEDFMLSEFKAKVKYHCEEKTLPDSTGEGGRNDLFFFIHNEDIETFSLPRLAYGISWWEDINYNNKQHLYSQEFLKNNPFKW